MKGKEISFTIPFMVAALEVLYFAKSIYGRRRFYLLIPFVVILVVIIDDPGVMDKVVAALQQKRVFSRSPLDGYRLMGRRVLDLSNFIQWGR